MNLGIVAAIAYGILAIIGGIIGYKKAQSKVSLISGIASGLLLILGAVLHLQGISWGLLLATIVTGVLIVVFTIRFAKTRKWMPAGLMVAVGVFTLAILLSTILRAT